MNMIASTVKTNDVDGAIKAFNALNNAVSLNSYGDTPIKACDFMQVKGVRNGRSGAPDTECVNTYIIDTEGTAYFTQSSGIASSVSNIITLFGDYLADGNVLTVQVVVMENKATGNTLKTLRVVQ